MKRWILLLILLFTMAESAFAMRLDADPRSIISFLDKSIAPELDILRVKTDISPDNHLIFQVKTKGEWTDVNDHDYLLLQILHEKTYALLVPLNEEVGGKVLVFEGELQTDNPLTSISFKKSDTPIIHTGFSAEYIARGAEFTVPLEWINFGADFSFDAYTIQAKVEGDSLEISEVYDQARKGRPQEKKISAITLLNNICSPKK